MRGSGKGINRKEEGRQVRGTEERVRGTRDERELAEDRKLWNEACVL